MKVNKGKLKEAKERWSLITKERERIEGTKNNLFFSRRVEGGPE